MFVVVVVVALQNYPWQTVAAWERSEMLVPSYHPSEKTWSKGSCHRREHDDCDQTVTASPYS